MHSLSQLFRKSTVWPYLLIGLFTFVAFGPTLKGGFLWDDHEIIEKNPWIQQITTKNLFHIFTNDVFDGKGDGYYRPLFSFSAMLDYRIWGLNPFGYHLTTFIYHLLTACCLFMLLKQLFDSSVALLASLFFSVHPIIIEQLITVCGRMEIMAFLFTLVCLLFVMKEQTWSWIVSLLFYAIACFSKESGVIAPLFLILISWYNKRYRVSWKWYVCCFLILAGFLFVRTFAVMGRGFPSLGGFGLSLIRDIPTILVQYLGTILFPFDLHSHRRMIFHTPWMYLSPLLIILLLLWSVVKRSRFALFCIGWYLIAISPKIPILATNALMLDHWIYPSGVGVFLMIAYGLIEWYRMNPTRPFMPLLATATIFLVWIAMSWWNTINRNTDEKLFSWAARYPSSSIVRCNLGLIYYQQGRYAEAASVLAKSLEMNPTDFFTRNNMALTLWKLGDKKKALNILDQCLRENPNNRQSQFNHRLISQ